MPKNNHPPVVLFLYRRPGNTLQLLNLIADSGANKLYVYADGPKSAQDKPVTDQVHNTVLDFAKSHPAINFVTHLSDNNLGLKDSIVSGLNQVFGVEQSAIILEDDCIPHPDFFPFVREMLAKYNNELKVMSVTGTGLQNHGGLSYDFSKYQLCWGWATWARAWKKYDSNLHTFDPRQDQKWLRDTWSNLVARWYWSNTLTMVKAGEIDTWDYQWSYTHLRQNGLVITPSTNLVSNIGFDHLATNTKMKSQVANMAVCSIDFPLTHPGQVVENKTLSQNIEHKFYTTPVALFGMLAYLLKSRFRRFNVT